MTHCNATKLGLAAGFFLAFAQASIAKTISLNFDSLPSAQGWTYYTDTDIPEDQIFSLENGVLTQNSLGVGAGYFLYEMANVIDPSLPFVVSVRARVLAEDGDLTRYLGAFGFYATTGTESYATVLRPNVIQDQAEAVVSETIDNTEFHDYRMEVTPGVASRLFVDGTLIGTRPVVGLIHGNKLRLGDGTHIVGDHAEITSLVFRQDEHDNSRGEATTIGVDSSTAGRIDYAGDNDWFRIKVGTAGKLTVFTVGTTNTYGYLLDSQGVELDRGDDIDGSSNRNFRIIRDNLAPGTYYVRVRHFANTGTGAYKLFSTFAATDGKAQRAVLLLHGMNSQPSTWNALVNKRWSGRCDTFFAGFEPPATAEPARDAKGAACYRVRFGAYDATGHTGLEGHKCTGKPLGCKGDYTSIAAPVGGEDLGLEVFGAVRGILNRLGSDTQIVLLGHSRGGLAARDFLQGQDNPERRSVVGLVTTGTPHRGTPLGRVYRYLKTNCLDASGARITSENKAGKGKAQWSACEDDWEAADLLVNKDDLYLGRPTIDFLAAGRTLRKNADGSETWPAHQSADLQRLNSATAVQRVPAAASTVQLRYQGLDLGDLHWAFSAWGISPLNFSGRSRNYALCGNVSACTLKEGATEFDGDGIVPVSSQEVPGVSGAVFKITNTYATGTRHGKETDRLDDMDWALQQIPVWK